MQQTIKFGDKTYRLKYSVGGKHIVESWLAKNNKPLFSSKLFATIPYVRQKSEKEDLIVNTLFDISYLYYLLWSLMITRENQEELTYEKLLGMIFDIEDITEHELSARCHATIREDCKEYNDIFDTIMPAPKKKRPVPKVPSGNITK